MPTDRSFNALLRTYEIVAAAYPQVTFQITPQKFFAQNFRPLHQYFFLINISSLKLSPLSIDWNLKYAGVGTQYFGICCCQQPNILEYAVVSVLNKYNLIKNNSNCWFFGQAIIKIFYRMFIVVLCRHIYLKKNFVVFFVLLLSSVSFSANNNTLK